MRLVVGSVLLVRAGSSLWGGPPLHTTLASASRAPSGLLLIAGLWTPLAGTVVAALEISLVVTMAKTDWFASWPEPGGALAMLGPGRWSVDTHLFGWKRVEAPPGGSTSNVL
jgi:putative oxidoreductase